MREPSGDSTVGRISWRCVFSWIPAAVDPETKCRRQQRNTVCSTRVAPSFSGNVHFLQVRDLCTPLKKQDFEKTETATERTLPMRTRTSWFEMKTRQLSSPTNAIDSMCWNHTNPHEEQKRVSRPNGMVEVQGLASSTKIYHDQPQACEHRPTTSRCFQSRLMFFMPSMVRFRVTPRSVCTNSRSQSHI